MEKIYFVGAGNMAYALAGAFTRGMAGVQIGIFDPSEERQQLFVQDFKSVTVFDSLSLMAKEADVLVLAVKPQVIPTVLKELSEVQGLVISIAAGIPLKTLKKAMPMAHIVRVMPNTPCLVGEMAAGCVFDASVSEKEQSEVLSLLSLAGTVIAVTEEQMDAITGLSGSGPAFVARFIQSFAKAGVELGLKDEDSMALSLATFSGTANLLKEKGLTPETLVKMVSSPNGTTVAGREVLEASDYDKIIKDTIQAATLRSEELGRG